jgi:DNA-binding response OmpR family regulator
MPSYWLDLEPERDRITRHEEPAGLLVLSSDESDHIALDRILRRTGRQVYYAYTCGEAVECMDAHRVFLVFCERDLPACKWQDVLAQISRRPHAPLLVVASRLADEQLWAEVLNRGGFDVLMKPFDAGAVRAVINAAEQAWLAQAPRKCEDHEYYDAFACCGFEPFVAKLPGAHEQS